MPSRDEHRVSIPGVELLSVLGRGASSVVYRARRAGVLCAVKVAREAGRDARWFRREAAALARVTDPGIPQVLEVGEVQGIPYLVMELVDGETLAERLTRGPLGEPATLELAEGVARVLMAIHRRGLIHRDLSPRNIVLETGGGVRVVDFGFATFAHSPRDAAGTRAYAAPEQLRVPVLVDARTDLYALGAILFECLTGKPPLSAGEQVDDSRLGAAVTTVLRGLLAPDPGDRYPNAGALLCDVARLRAGDAPHGPEENRTEAPEALPFVGRASERAQLLHAWADARQGRGRAVLLLGPAGSGKSRLVSEVTRAITTGAGTLDPLEFRCAQAEPRPLAALRGLCDRMVESVHRLEEHARRRVLDAIVRGVGRDLGPVVEILSPRLAALLELDPTERPAVNAETFSELTAELFSRFAREVGPLAICVDDAQWLEPASVEVFGRLADRAEEAPLLLILAARTNPFEGRPEANIADRLFELELGPFAGSATAALVEGYLGSTPDPALLGWLINVSDGTPLGFLEVLDAMLDHGALAPRDGTWLFDRNLAERMHLPRGALALLVRRLGDLPPAARTVFQTAAVIGLDFDDTLLAEASGLDQVDLGFALAEGRRARLVEALRSGRHRFIHDSIREALLADLGADRRRAIHGRIADILYDRGDDDLYTLARHYAAAEPDAPAKRALDVTRAAALRSHADLDGEAALGFFEVARSAAERGELELDAEILQSAGEAALRLGAHEESIAHLEAALRRTSLPHARAHLLGCIAWAEQARSRPDSAWAALERAFAELHEEMPVEAPGSLGRTLIAWRRSQLQRRDRDRADQDTVELLCQLHYQNARLGLEYDRPLRLLQSTLRARDLALRSGRASVVARVEAMYGSILTMMGRRRAGREHLQRARTLAREAGDPALETFCLHLDAFRACFASEFDHALSLTRQLFDERGAWLDMHDYCLDVYNAHLIETMRGRPRVAWEWLERAIDRAAPHGRAPAAFVMVAQCARATLAALHSDLATQDVELALRIPVTIDSSLSGFARKCSWGSRARYLVERGEIGEELDALVAEFEKEGIKPRRAHPVLVEYYVAVVEARINRCLRTHGAERARRVRELEKAIGDLRGIARYRLFEAHLRLAEGFHAWLTGDHEKARDKLGEAERLADRETAPGVLFGVARAHAHILRSEGRREAARERARMALAIARDLGAVQRMRWVQEELGGSWSTMDAARRSIASPTSGSSRRQLRALLELLRVCNGELEQESQARLLVDELLGSVGGDRGLLVFDPERRGEGGVTAARARGGEDWSPTPHAHALVGRTRESGQPEAGTGEELPPNGEHDVPPCVAVPLFLNDRVVGGVYLERNPGQPPFGDEEMEVLVALSYQVPVALELARALAEREKLEQSLRRAQRMETVGRFAGGIAHDFNNMLTAMQGSLSSVMENQQLPPEPKAELAIAQGAVRRAAELTRQLLTFARRQVPTSETRDLNEVLTQLVPMLQRLLGARIEVRLDLRADRPRAKIDGPLFEQSIVNLALNARDAMPDGGTLTLATEDVSFREEDARPQGLEPGDYVAVIACDTGIGMPRHVKESAFDPFFTTKGRGRGTGLGLSIVYGFVHQSGGGIELDSEPEHGTSVHLYLPRSDVSPLPASYESARPPAPDAHEEEGAETILLVDDEELVLRSIRRHLERSGYRVFAAGGADAALEIVRSHEGEIDLLITDVLLPGMPGTDLARTVSELSPRTKLLLISGYTDGALEERIGEANATFLQKPFSPQRLGGVVRELLDRAPS